MPSRIPFQHSSLEVKQEFLRVARDFHNKRILGGEEGVAYELAAALLYMNMADYLAQYLAYGIAQLAGRAVGEFHFGVISVKEPTLKNITIEQSIRMLELYDFPRKFDVMEVLKEVKATRNKLAHEILKAEPSELNEVDDAVTALQEDTERLIEIVDQIQPGMPPKNMKQRLAGLESAKPEMPSDKEKK